MLAAEVTAAVDGFLDDLDRSPASFGPTDRGVINELLSPPPEHGASSISDLLETILTASRTGFDTAAGSQLSYIPVSSTTIASRLTIRLAFLNHRTTIAIADRATDLVAEATCLSHRCEEFACP